MLKILALCAVSLTAPLALSARQTQSGAQGGQVKIAASPSLAEADALHRQVVKLYQERKFSEALPIAERVLALREKELEKTHQLVGNSLFNLATIYIELKRYNDGHNAYQRALKIYEKAYGPESVRLCVLLDNFGWVSYALGNSREAESLFGRSLSIREKTLGAQHADVLRSYLNLARLRQNLGDYARAVDFYQQALRIKEGLTGPKDKELGELLEQCACAMQQNKRGEETQQLLARARNILEGEGQSLATLQEDVINGKALFKPAPAYPPEASQARVGGVVVVFIVVDEGGRVVDAKTKCGHQFLAQASEGAARRARFTPTTVGGNPVKVSGWITYNYVLH